MDLAYISLIGWCVGSVTTWITYYLVKRWP